MARILNPLSSEDASGSIGDQLTFAHWKRVRQARAFSRTPNPNTESQRLVRAAFVDVQRLWGTLSPDQAEGWREYARQHPMQNRFGEFVATGLNWLNRVNLMYKFVGSAKYPILDAPTDESPGNVYDFRVEVLANALVKIWWSSPAGYAEGTILQVWRQGDYAHGNRRLRQPEQRWSANLLASMGSAIPVEAQGEDRWGYLGIQVIPLGYPPERRWWILFRRERETTWTHAIQESD